MLRLLHGPIHTRPPFRTEEHDMSQPATHAAREAARRARQTARQTARKGKAAARASFGGKR